MYTAESVYRASPECRERRCQVAMWYEIMFPRVVIQHGERPEAVMFVDKFIQVTRPAEETRQQFREFAERCHRYEDGASPDDSHSDP